MATHVLRRNSLRNLSKYPKINRISSNLCRYSECSMDKKEPEHINETLNKRIFSGIQPTGNMHLGNYFGAVSQWIKMQNENNDMLISIVDLHSITLPQNCEELRANIFKMTACLLACGLDVNKCTLFQQSRVHQHTELAWVLSCLTTLARLNRLPQYKEKSSKLKEIPLSLFIYPVLQCADILLYKATHVPVGEDQLQHIQLAQHLARAFNNTHGPYFPSPKAILGDDDMARVKSLRDPTKKMSKSDPDPRSRIELTDSDDVILEKMKKAMADFTSEVTYDPKMRPAVSNLVSIECLLMGRNPQEVCQGVEGLETAQYKLRLADLIVAAIGPIRTKISDLMNNRDYLENVLRDGSERAERVANVTWNDVRRLVGLSQ